MKALARILACAALVVVGIAPDAVLGEDLLGGRLVGRAIDQENRALEGVRVSLSSPVLRQARSVLTDRRGNYVFHGLPPGFYTVSFELEGMAELGRRVALELGRTARSDAALEPAEFDEAIIILARRPSAVETVAVGSNLRQETVDFLAVDRSAVRLAELGAGATLRVPRADLGQISMSGGFGFDNELRVDGVDVTLPGFGVATDGILGMTSLLPDEGALETQVTTAALGPHLRGYGGGALHVLTRGAGSRLAGSLRADLNNPSWRDETSFEVESSASRSGATDAVWSATLSGPIIAERLWFFGALQAGEGEDPSLFAVTGEPLRRSWDDQRTMLKAEAALGRGHLLRGLFLHGDAKLEAPSLPISVARRTQDVSDLERDLWSLGYRGVLGGFFADLRYSRVGAETALVETPLGAGGLADAPIFSLSLDPAHYGSPFRDPFAVRRLRRTESAASLSWLLSTPSLASHDLVVGLEISAEQLQLGDRRATLHLLRADYLLDASGRPVLDAAGRLQPLFVPGRSGLVGFRTPTDLLLDLSEESLFFNDRVILGRRVVLNLGLRYEDRRSRRSTQAGEVGGARLLPRVGVSLDPFSDGRTRFDFGYSRYGARLHPSLAARGSALDGLDWTTSTYEGPAGAGFDFAPGFLVSNYSLGGGERPGTVVELAGDLQGPLVEEISVSAAAQVGPIGYVELSWVDRQTFDLIEDSTILGEPILVEAALFDRGRISSSPLPVRRMRAFKLQGGLQLTRRWSGYAHWTYQSRNDGNYQGESDVEPALLSVLGDYPEILSAGRGAPQGRLASYQQHRAVAWSTYHRTFSGVGSFAFSVLYRYDSAPLYSGVAYSIPLSSSQIADDPGYALPPGAQTVFFDYGRFELDETHLVDAAIRYAPALGRVEPWVKLEVRNLFNDRGQVRGADAVMPLFDGPLDADGVWLESTPLPGFGEPRRPEDTSRPREYRLSIGVGF